MNDPFKIDGPTCISFSGGRTSGYMLWRIIQAHGGTLPDDVRVMFANTGKEMPQTLDFVQASSDQWGVPITWVEYRAGEKWAEVDYKTASRNGEPFATLIKDRTYLPNPVARFCTVQLKILTMERCLKACGWTDWQVAIGFRADEDARVRKLLADPSGSRAGVYRVAPLAEADVTVAEVSAFWAAQPFDLLLPNMGGKTMHGNCDLCFLKGGAQKLSLIRENPDRALWWMEQEKLTAVRAEKAGAFFRIDQPSYAQLHAMATGHGELFPFGDDPLADCFCGD